MGKIFFIIAFVVFLILGLAGAGIIDLKEHAEVYWALLGFGLAAFTLPSLL